MSDEEAKRIVTAAAGVLLEAALRVIEGDPHQFSTRPCQTCRIVSGLAARPFGCSAKALEPPRRS